jgi:hypothetical protein
VSFAYHYWAKREDTRVVTGPRRVFDGGAEAHL